MKQCTQCHEVKALNEFYTEKHGKLGVKGKCKVCIEAYKARHKVRDTQQMQRHNRQLKRNAFKLLGGCRCALCSESNFDRLNIDHIHNDGVKLRKIGRHGRGVTFYNQILKMSLAERSRLRVLCVRCNVLASRYTDAVIRKMHLARLQGMKYCPGCKTVKTTSAFHKDAGTRGGLRLRCKDCVANYHRAYRQQGHRKNAA